MNTDQNFVASNPEDQAIIARLQSEIIRMQEESQKMAQQMGQTPLPLATTTPAVKPLTFGPMAPVAPTQPPATPVAPTQPTATTQEQAIMDRIMALLSQQNSVTTGTKSATPVAPEDQRVLDVLSRLFPTGRDAIIKARYPVGTNLSVVEVAYTPSTGTRRETEALVFDDGTRTFVFGAV